MERALPGNDHTKTTNNRLPSRSTDTESDYQHSEWLLLIEKRENRARARTHYMMTIQLPLPGAHARTTPSSCGSMEVINGYSAAGFESNTVYGENGLLLCTSGRPAPGLPLATRYYYYCTNRGIEECRLASRDFKRVVSRR